MGRTPAWPTAPISIAILPYTTSLDVRKPSLAIARYSVASIKSASFRGSTVPATMSFAAFTEPRITPLAPMKTVPAAATISPSKVPLMVIDSGPLISMTPLKVMLGAKTVPSLGAVRREDRLSMTDPVKLICGVEYMRTKKQLQLAHLSGQHRRFDILQGAQVAAVFLF